MLLAAVVAAFFGLARYTRGKVWQRILARNGVNLVQESNSVTWSQSVRGRTVFTVHAAKSLPHGNGQYTLRDAVLILYGKDGRNDRISGSQFEYDQKQEVLRAVGEVHMDLEAPRAAGGHTPNTPGQTSGRGLTFSPTDETAEDPGLIHVRTSGLVYVRKLGVAATSEAAEFRYKGMTCTSTGAEFDSGQDILRLLADVHMTGMLRNKPFTLTAARADLDRTANTADLREPSVESGKRTATAAHALLHLGKDGALETADADGNVRLSSGTGTVGSPRLHADFAAQDRMQHALFSGGVTFLDTNKVRPANGSTQTLDLNMNAQGALSTVVGNGGVTLVLKQEGAAEAAATRQMRAQRATASFAADPRDPKRTLMHVLKMTGGAEFAAESKVPARQMSLTKVDADELTTTFVAGNGRYPDPQRMVGNGHTQMTQSGADGQHELSTGETLDVGFAQRMDANGTDVAEVSTALQTGHVEVRSWPAVKAGTAAQGPSTGYAQQALFEAAEGTLTLTAAGDARAEVDDGQTQIRAPKIVLHQGTGDGEASGGVVASTGGEAGGPATHVLAARAQLLHGAAISEFFGTDAQPVRMWQGGSQVQAAKIVLDGRHHTMSARPESGRGAVDAVFSSVGQTEKAGRASTTGTGDRDRTAERGPGAAPGAAMTPASRDTVQVRAAAMDYSDAQHQATFNGDVLMRDPAGVVTGRRAAVFLQGPVGKTVGGAAGRGTPSGTAEAPNMGGKLERAVVIGNVRVTEPGRTGAGEQITYTAASNSFVLTGTAASPPWVRDAQQGFVTGTALVFGASDSSIVVTGTHAPGNQGKPTRVHTETGIKQQ